METGRAAPGGRSPPPPVPAGRHLRRAHRTLARQSGAPPKPTFRDRGPGGAAAVCDLGTVPCALSSLLCAPGHRRRRIVSHLPYRALVPFARSHSPFGQRWKVPRSPRREHQVPERNSQSKKLENKSLFLEKKTTQKKQRNQDKGQSSTELDKPVPASALTPPRMSRPTDSPGEVSTQVRVEGGWIPRRFASDRIQGRSTQAGALSKDLETVEHSPSSFRFT